MDLDGRRLCLHFGRWCCLRAVFHPSTSIFVSVVLRSGACHKMLFFPEILMLSSRVLFQAASTELQSLGRLGRRTSHVEEFVMFSPISHLRKQRELQAELTSSAYMMEAGSSRCPGWNTFMYQECSPL